MSLWSWLSGHDDKEASLYANFDAVDVTVDRLNTISTSSVSAAQDNINAALQRLNSTKGLNQYVGTVDASTYEPMFQSLHDSIGTLGAQMTDKADTIKEYNDENVGNFFEKAGSTTLMALCNVGEGLLSVGEELIDGLYSIRGWVAGKFGNTEKQEQVAAFISKDLARDAFSWYYDSDLAKQSAFTEDSFLANTFKIAGKTVGYLYAGGVLTGMGGALGAGTGKVGEFALKLASSSTWGATIAGAVGGLGKGVETGLQTGLTYNESMGLGAKTGLIQGGLAFAGGKASEYVQSVKATGHGGMDALKNSSQYQGFNDSITKAGQDFGRAQVETVKSGLSAVGSSAKASGIATRGLNPIEKAAAENAASTARQTFSNNLKNLITSDNPIAQGLSAIKGGVSSLGTAAGNIKNNGLGNTVKGGASSVADTFKNATSSVKSGGLLSSAAGSISPNLLSTAGVLAGVAYGQYKSPSHDEVLTNNVSRSGNDGSSDVIGGDEVPVGTDTTNNDYTIVDEANVPIEAETPIDTTRVAEEQFTQATQPAYNSVDQSGAGSPSGGGGTSGGGGSPSYTPMTTPALSIATTPASEIATVPETKPETTITTIPLSALSTLPPTTVPIASPSTTPGGTTETTEPAGGGGGGGSDTPGGGTDTPGGGGSDTPGGGGDIPIGASVNDLPTGDDTPEHSGGGISGGGSSSNELLGAERLQELDESDDESSESSDKKSSIDSVINGSKFTKIPSSTVPTVTKKKKTNPVIPIAAGLSVAAAAGIGAKAYIDSKNNNEFDEDEEYNEDYEDYEPDGWDEDEEDESIGENFTDASVSEDLSGDYYQDNTGYSARSNEELADLQ